VPTHHSAAQLDTIQNLLLQWAASDGKLKKLAAVDGQIVIHLFQSRADPTFGPLSIGPAATVKLIFEFEGDVDQHQCACRDEQAHPRGVGRCETG
jgi:hypothetical protein